MKSTDRSYAVTKTEEQWREELSPAEYQVLRQAGTERPFVGEYTDAKTEGVYACRACGAE
jgi:peptide-methionine (R)-S-oxide reductase